MSPSTRTACFARVTGANFCFFLTFASFFLLPLHVRALGGTERTIGLVMGTSGLAGLVSVLAVGALLDRFGRRIFLLAGLATMSAAAGAFLLVDRIGPGIFLLRAVQGLAFAAGFNAASTLAAEFAPEGRRAAALGLFGVSTLATHALAPTLGEQLVRLGGFPALFVAAAVFSAVGLAVAWPLPDDAPARTHAAGPLRATAELSTAIATVACCGVAFGAVITYVPTFVQDAALGPIATFFLSYTAAAVLTRVAAGGLSDSLGRRTVVLAGARPPGRLDRAACRRPLGAGAGHGGASLRHRAGLRLPDAERLHHRPGRARAARPHPDALQRGLQPGHDDRLDGARPGGAGARPSRHVPGRGRDGGDRARGLRRGRTPGQSRARDVRTQRVISATMRPDCSSGGSGRCAGAAAALGAGRAGCATL